MPAGQAGHVGTAEHGVTALWLYFLELALYCRFFTLLVHFHQWTIRPGPVSPLILVLWRGASQ